MPFLPAVLLYPQQSVPTLRYSCRHLPSAVPWISEDRLLAQEYRASRNLGGKECGFGPAGEPEPEGGREGM